MTIPGLLQEKIDRVGEAGLTTGEREVAHQYGLLDRRELRRLLAACDDRAAARGAPVLTGTRTAA